MSESAPGDSSALDTLRTLGASPMSGVYLHSGCPESAIQEMQAAARRDLGEEFPGAFVELLRVSDGVQIANAFFEGAKYIVLDNLDLGFPQVTVLGHSGNNAHFVFDRRDRRFHITNFCFPHERFRSFDTFEEMLVAVMKAERVL